MTLHHCFCESPTTYPGNRRLPQPALLLKAGDSIHDGVLGGMVGNEGIPEREIALITQQPGSVTPKPESEVTNMRRHYLPESRPLHCACVRLRRRECSRRFLPWGSAGTECPSGYRIGVDDIRFGCWFDRRSARSSPPLTCWILPLPSVERRAIPAC